MNEALSKLIETREELNTRIQELEASVANLASDLLKEKSKLSDAREQHQLASNEIADLLGIERTPAPQTTPQPTPQHTVVESDDEFEQKWQQSQDIRSNRKKSIIDDLAQQGMLREGANPDARNKMMEARDAVSNQVTFGNPKNRSSEVM